MKKRARVSPPRRLLFLFFAVTLVPAAGLVWLGWRLLDQDRQLEMQRAMEHREYAADRIVGLLQQEIASTRQILSDYNYLGKLTSEDFVVVQLIPAALSVHPASAILYYPVVPHEPEAPIGPFLSAEKLEYREKDY